MRRVSLHWLLFFVGNSVALLMWVKLFEMPDEPWMEVFQTAFRRYLPFIICSTLLLPAFVWDTVKLTTRFAGPIYRLRSALKQVASGERIKPIHFRHGDFWNEIATNFNRVVGAVDNSKSAASSASGTGK